MNLKKLICVAVLCLIQITSIYAACKPKEIALDIDISGSEYSTTKALGMISLTFGSRINDEYINTTTNYGYGEGQTIPSEKIDDGHWIVCVPEESIKFVLKEKTSFEISIDSGFDIYESSFPGYMQLKKALKNSPERIIKFGLNHIGVKKGKSRIAPWIENIE